MVAQRDVELVQETARELRRGGHAERAQAVEAVLAHARRAGVLDHAALPADLLSVADAADVLGVSRQTVRNRVAAGRLPALRIAGRLVIPRDAVLAEVSASTEMPGTPPPDRPAAGEREWQAYLNEGLPADKVARLQMLHTKLEDDTLLDDGERREMAVLEAEIARASQERIRQWLSQTSHSSPSRP